MDDYAKEEALINCCQKRPWLQSIKVYILQKIASPSNFRTCMDVCKCFAQMRKPQKNSSVKMHISLVVSWVPRNSFCCHHLLARPTLGTNIGHFREKLNLFRDIAWTYLLPYYSKLVFGNVYLWAEQHYFCNVMGLKLRLKLRNRWLLQGASTIYFWLLGNSDSELSINLALFWGSLRSKGCSVLFYLLSILWHWWKAKSDQAKIQPSWRKFLNNFKHELLFAAATNWKDFQSCYIFLSIVWHWWKAESDQAKIQPGWRLW